MTSDTPESLPFVSVIVPVCRDADGLRRCLPALAGQTYPSDRFEILIVDNDGGEGPSVYARLIAPFGSRARIVRETTPGAYAARNRGIADAAGDLLAFTDADCRPAPGWLTEGARRWQALSPDSAVGGEIRLVFDAPSRTAPELFDQLLLGFRQRDFIEKEGFAATANLFCGRGAFTRAGLFDATMMSSGDKEWGRRAGARGVGLFYEPGAVVEHAARATFSGLALKVLRTCGGRRAMRSREHAETWRESVAAEWKAAAWRLMKWRKAPDLAPRGARLRLLAVIFAINALCVLEAVRLARGGRPVRR